MRMQIVLPYRLVRDIEETRERAVVGDIQLATGIADTHPGRSVGECLRHCPAARDRAADRQRIQFQRRPVEPFAVIEMRRGLLHGGCYSLGAAAHLPE